MFLVRSFESFLRREGLNNFEPFVLQNRAGKPDGILIIVNDEYFFSHLEPPLKLNFPHTKGKGNSNLDCISVRKKQQPKARTRMSGS